MRLSSLCIPSYASLSGSLPPAGQLSYLPGSLEDDGVIAHLALGDAQGGQEAGHGHGSGACRTTLMSINVNMRNISL